MKSSLLSWAICLNVFFLSCSTAVYAQTSTSITIDGKESGRIFDGIGALSAGASSALLWDYPRRERDQILNYLFKPNYGASLQILKVEIGGDMNSTDGAEESSQRTPTDTNYNRGYEWWLMEQAKKRNPNIKLYGLEWGAPGWFKGGFWSRDNIDYIINWIKHAQSDHDLHIDYIGGWNESGWNAKWFEELKAALRRNGLTTEVVGADNWWNVVPAIKKDSSFRAGLDVIGIHYPCGWESTTMVCPDDSVARRLGLPIWASEAGSQNYNFGADALARGINRDYIDSRITAMINWSLICSWYPGFPFWGDGLMLADEPWSGHYEVGKSIWAVAQTTQFAKPGWKYLDGACGYLGNNSLNGSYVALESPDRRDYSVIIETVDASSSQTVRFSVSGGLSTSEVHVWRTWLPSVDPDEYFVHQTNIKPKNGRYTLELQPQSIYSITTTTGQHKGTAVSPPSAIMRLPFEQDFNNCRLGSIPKYFDSIQGAFDVDSARGGRRGLCLRQEINIPPILWHYGSPTPPLVVFGDTRWTNYKVSVDALLEGPGYVDLIGRLNKQMMSAPGASQGYHLRVFSSGKWELFAENDKGQKSILASGKTSIGINAWHRLSIRFDAGTIEAFIDSSLVAKIKDSSYGFGQVGLLVNKWQNADFDNVSVVRTSNSSSFFDKMSR